MKTIGGIATCVVAALVSGCVATPNLIGEGTAGIAPTKADAILIVVDGKVFDAPAFGSEGRAYLAGLGDGIRDALAGVPTKVVELDEMRFVNPVPLALQAMRPSHTIGLFTESDILRYGTPISATWQMEVSNVTQDGSVRHHPDHRGELAALIDRLLAWRGSKVDVSP